MQLSQGRAPFALLALAAGSLLSAPASAQVNGPCGVPAIGDLFIECVIAGTTVRYGGTAQAGENAFLNTHSPIRITNPVGNAMQVLPPIDVTSNPVWTTTPVGTRLRLDGRINIFEANAFVRIVFQGFLGPNLVNLIDTGNVLVDTDLAITNLNPAAPAGAPAVSRMIITISGGASYVAVGSPTFAGAVPEPATVVLVGAGLLVIGAAAGRRRLAIG